jgi:hypothetical protein
VLNIVLFTDSLSALQVLEEGLNVLNIVLFTDSLSALQVLEEERHEENEVVQIMNISDQMISSYFSSAILFKCPD